MECVGPITCAWAFIGENVASIIATCAMAATFWQGYIARKHNKLSVKPFLDINRHSDYTAFSFKLSLVNQGLGPAIITSYSMKVEQKDCSYQHFHLKADELFKVLSEAVPDLDPIKLSIYTMEKGNAYIQPGEIIDILAINIPLEIYQTTDKALLRAKLDSISYCFDYESIYGQKSQAKYSNKNI
ncbi:hypothetical protein [Neptuniibacter sp.]|uniref:hypothetical protein n=1 Tax=Neptuniibacter sp. TaxID=1962643 RepID=UPI003B5B9D47